MNTFLHNLQVAGIAIAVCVLGGVAQSLTNFHPTDALTQFFMTVVGGVVIGGLNGLIHKLQGTAVVSTEPVTPAK